MNEPRETEPNTSDTQVPGSAGPVVIIANPASGNYNRSKLDEIISVLEAGGRQVALHLTSHAGEIAEICANRNLATGTLVVAGGDGSVNEALTGLQTRKTTPDLAIVPFGTTNVLALELGLPNSAQEIANMVLGQRTKPLHYGIVNEHPFVLMASAGFDAEVVHAVPGDLKRRFKKLAYVITALRTGFQRKSTPLTGSLAAEPPIQCKFAVATNARHYGGPFVICPGGVTDPGLHMLVLEKDDPWSSIRYSLALLLNRMHKIKGAAVLPFTEATITSVKPVAAQLSGDPFGVTPLNIRAADKTVPILVP